MSLWHNNKVTLLHFKSTKLSILKALGEHTHACFGKYKYYLSIYQLLYISQIILSCTYFLKVALKE